jgi:HEAT repeat protein
MRASAPPPCASSARSSITRIDPRHPDHRGAVTDPDPSVRAAVACLYGSVGLDSEAETIVAALLDGTDEAARAAGLDALRRLGRPVPAGIASASLADPSPRVRASAIDAIAAGAGPAMPVDVALAALDDDAAGVRTAAARALRARDDVPPELLDILSSPSVRAQDAALSALDGHGPQVQTS